MSGFIAPPWRITSPFGMRVHPITGARKMHNGDDFDAGEGAPIKAVAPGVVEAKGVSLDRIRGYGHWVAIRNYDGSRALYPHMREASPLTVGTSVSHDTVVGYVGSTGASTGPHLHLEIAVNGTPVPPSAYMAARPVPPDDSTLRKGRTMERVYIWDGAKRYAVLDTMIPGGYKVTENVREAEGMSIATPVGLFGSPRKVTPAQFDQALVQAREFYEWAKAERGTVAVGTLKLDAATIQALAEANARAFFVEQKKAGN